MARRSASVRTSVGAVGAAVSAAWSLVEQASRLAKAAQQPAWQARTRLESITLGKGRPKAGACLKRQAQGSGWLGPAPSACWCFVNAKYPLSGFHKSTAGCRDATAGQRS